jgi:hypothetical protein
MPESRLPEGRRATFRFAGELLLDICEPLLSCAQAGSVRVFALTLYTE